MIMNCGPGAPAVELGEPKTFVLAFDPNGSGEYFAPLVYVSDEIMHEFTIPYEGEWNDDWQFLGWATAADAREAEYVSGDAVRVAEGTTTLYAVWKFLGKTVYVLDIAVETSDPVERCTYPATVTYDGELYGNACYGYTPASGTALNTWAEDYDSGTGLVSGIVPGILKDGVFEEAEDKTVIPEGAEGEDAVTYIPTWYLSMINDGETIRVAFATEPLDDTFHDYAGSLGSERVGHFMMSCYDGSGSSSGIYSWATGSSPTYSISITNCIAGCQARGEGYDLLTWPQWTYFGALTAIMWRSTDLQTAFAYGTANAAVKNACASIETTEYGMAGEPGEGTDHMAFFWIEDLWNNIGKWCGAHSDASWRLEWNTGYCSTTEWDMTAQSPALDAALSAGWLTRVVGSTEAGFYPQVNGGNSSSYFADYSRIVASDFPSVGCGNSSGSGYGPYGGPFCSYFYYSAASADTAIGGRLVYRL